MAMPRAATLVRNAGCSYSGTARRLVTVPVYSSGTTFRLISTSMSVCRCTPIV